MTCRIVCRDCNVEKSDSEFYPQGKSVNAKMKICKACSKATTQRWRVNNRQRNAENSKRWASENPEKVKLSARSTAKKYSEKNVARAVSWMRANPDRHRSIANAWVKQNAGKVNANTARYRASKIKAKPAWANEFFISEAYDLARLRGEICGGDWHVDHIVPLRCKTVCGLHVEFNVQVIRNLDNIRKGNRYWPNMP